MQRHIAAGLTVTLGLLLGGGMVGQAAPRPPVVHLAAGTAQNEFAFVPKEITVAAGQPVTLTLANKGKIQHDLGIEALKVKFDLVDPGKSASVTFTPARKGSYEFVCIIPGHKEAGMKGVLIVK